MILHTLRFIFNAIKLCFLIRDNRKERMKQNGAAAIRDLQEKMGFGPKEKGSLGLHLDTCEGIACDDSKKETV